MKTIPYASTYSAPYVGCGITYVRHTHRQPRWSGPKMDRYRVEA